MWTRGTVPAAVALMVAAWLSCVSFVQAQVPAVAPAQRPLKDAITVEPGASCLQATRLWDHVATWLGRTQVRADVRVVVRGDTTDPRRISFELIQGPRSRTRVFESSPEICGDMHAVVGLAIALAIDAEATSNLATTEGAVTSRSRLLVAIQASVAYEALPGLSLGGQLGAERELLPWLSARLDGFAQHSRRDTIVGSGGTFDATLVAGSLALCTGGRLDPSVRFSLCAGLASGAVYAEGDGFAPNRSDTGFWLAVRSGVRLEIQLGVPWVLDLDVISGLVSPTFESGPLGSSEHVRTPSSTALGVSLGPALVF